jgi:hypothetical protein
MSAFMNFGAYHTFAETFPIGRCMAEGTAQGDEHVGSTRPTRYEPTIDERRATSLHEGFHQAVDEFVGGLAAARVAQYRSVSRRMVAGRPTEAPLLHVVMLSHG